MSDPESAESPDVPSREIIDAAGIRDLAGVSSRQALIDWRKKHGFPPPLLTQTHVELWDRRDVQRWIRQHRGN